MTDLLLPPERISSAVFRHWAETLGEGVRTIYPGLRIETASLSEWFEIWVDHWTPRAQRQQAPELCDVRVTVHAFVKATTEKDRVQALMGQARLALSGRTLPIADPETSDAPPLGYVKLGTADIKELTRLDADARRHGLQHHVGLWHGIAQRVLHPAS